MDLRAAVFLAGGGCLPASLSDGGGDGGSLGGVGPVPLGRRAFKGTFTLPLGFLTPLIKAPTILGLGASCIFDISAIILPMSGAFAAFIY